MSLVSWLVFVPRTPSDETNFAGWFYGDFFMDDYAPALDYSGIYRYFHLSFLAVFGVRLDIHTKRYLNNPEIMAGAAFFGMALISGSKLVYILAGVRHVSYWWLWHYVEQCVLMPNLFFFFLRPMFFFALRNSPHMRKLYGDSLRKDAGFTKVVKKVASRNAQLLESRAGRHAPEIRRVVREVRGTFEKVYEDTADVVEEFLAKCMRPQLLSLNWY